MLKLGKKIIEEVSAVIKDGGIAVIPTDTIYGIVCSAMDQKSVERLYKTRKRNPEKPMIILIGSIDALKLFGINLNREQKSFLKQWPEKTSIILGCEDKKLRYLHRGKNSLAFRIPGNPDLIKLLKATGPLVAPSANPEGKKPAETIEQAQDYFRDKADLYLDCGRMKSKPSRIISFLNGRIEIVRK
jgi:L-threonylcarbamoyladenylate synthase